LCHRPSVGRGARSRVPGPHRAVESVRDDEGLYRAARIVTTESSAGSGRVVLSRAQGRLRLRARHAARRGRPLQVRSLVLTLHRISRARAGVRAVLPVLITLSPTTHYELYHDWRKAIAFCRTLPDASPQEPVTFHMYWRERVGAWWPTVRPFGRKQALPVKAFLATQDLSTCSLILWSDRDLSTNEWVAPLRDRIELRIYDPAREVRGTPLEPHPRIYNQRDRRVYRDGDLFRILVLHNYGGVYADMDTVLLRSLGVFLDQEFVYQWDKYDDLYAPALMRLRQGSAFAQELVRGVLELPAGKYNWGRENVKRAIQRGHAISVFPSPFFNTEWQAGPGFKPFERTPASANLYEGAFAWHWHNQWDAPIEPGSKFQRLEAMMDEKLTRMGVCSR